MKKFIYIFSVSLAVLLSSCQDKVIETYTVNTPEYMTYDDLRTAFEVKSGEIIIQPGKIYFKDNYIFINEYQKGIHVVNNNDPANPQVVSFIEIPGNVDMAIKGNMLYADSYVDLLTIDISDLSNIVEVDRDTNVFPYIIPDVENGVIESIDDSKGVIVGYTQKQVSEKVENGSSNYMKYRDWGWGATDDVMFMAEASSGIGNSGTGTGGSMARFTLYNDYLYAIDNASLHLFNVSVADNPQFQKQIPISWQIETIFPYEKKLFIGAQSGMYVYSLQNPANPEYISEFRHASACDPVVVDGDYAYVTLRGGNLCGAIESQLDVIDISQIEFPDLVKTYPMEEPYGLGINNDVLFVCDGDAGLKVYKANDVMKIDSNMIAHYSDINAFDVIPLGDVLLMIGIDGFYQYDYSDLNDIKLLSYIPIYDN